MIRQVEPGVVVNLQRVIAAGKASSAPLRRLLTQVGEGMIIDLTYGRPRQTVVVMDSGHLILLAIPPEGVIRARENSYCDL